MLFLVGAFATYRLALLVTEDRITFPLRRLAGVRRDGDAEIVPDGWLAYLVTCIRCCSVWAAVGVALILAWPESWEWLAFPLAYSGSAVAIDAWVRRR
jgi:hypothetical protein